MNERENELFEEWWGNEGQYHRAGGSEYCKTFAYHAWEFVVNREGYKLVPVEINNDIEYAMLSSVARGEMPCDIYKAMIGAVDE